MDMQGFPLYAVDPEYPDTVYVVVGWIHGRMPKLVPLTHGARGGQATREPSEDRTYRFTVTDPRESAPEPDALRERLYALADELERGMPGFPPAVRLREELDK